MSGDYLPTIGLEVHVQLATRSKLFSGAPTAFGAAPNTQACAIDLGMPGVLPVLNEEAVTMALIFALAIDAEVGRRSTFDRKNYFYPDLPKGYQVSQFADPIVGRGRLAFTLPDGGERQITITRAHLEEDAGKSVHDAFAGLTGVDLNRAGTPLLEIVTEPELATPEEAIACLRHIHALVRYLGICDGNMAEGSLRCDINVSLRRRGETALGQRTEIKNVNSFRFAERALRFEIDRQASLLDAGRTVERVTLQYDADRDETRPMRAKEFSNDYRYFPEPDLPPLLVTDAMLAAARARLPELPECKRARFERDYGLPAADARQLCVDRALADCFERVAAASGNAKAAANWLLGDVAALLNRADAGIERSPVAEGDLATLIRRIDDGTISTKIAKTLLDALAAGERDVDAMIAARGLRQVSDAATLDALIAQVVAAHPAQVADYRAADADKRRRKLGFFVGRIMQASGGKANPRELNERLLAVLDAAPAAPAAP
jgi:aspartyl-tRNA(Asn)/glutamyl-tRNA(Gln) amidotransferase subunit B